MIHFVNPCSSIYNLVFYSLILALLIYSACSVFNVGDNNFGISAG